MSSTLTPSAPTPDRPTMMLPDLSNLSGTLLDARGKLGAAARDMSDGIALNFRYNATTLPSDTQTTHFLQVNDTGDSTESYFGQAITLAHNLNSGYNGSRNSFYVNTSLNAKNPHASTNNDHNYCAGTFACNVNYPQNPGVTAANGAFFGGNFVVALQAGASPNGEVAFNACPAEFDSFGRAPVVNRAMIQLGYDDTVAATGGGFDCLISMGSLGGPAAGKIRDGLLFNATPLSSSTGSLIRCTGADTILDGINLAAYSISRNILSAQNGNILLNGTGGLFLQNAAAALTLGSTTSAVTASAQLKMRSGGGGDYDTAFISIGGTSTAGKGSLVTQAAELVTPIVRPSADNVSNCGTPGNRYAIGYFAGGTATSSDVRLKESIERLDPDTSGKLIDALQPSSWVWIDRDEPAVMGKRTVQRHKTEPVEVTEHVHEGDRIVARKVIHQQPVTQVVPVHAEDGTPLTTWERYSLLNDDGTPQTDVASNQLKGYREVPLAHAVPVMEDVEEPYEVSPAVKAAYTRRHHGLIAQEVREALGAAGMDASEDPLHSDHGIFIYDRESDSYHLRPEQLIPHLIAVAKDERAKRMSLEARLDALEAKTA